LHNAVLITLFIHIILNPSIAKTGATNNTNLLGFSWYYSL